MAEIKNLIFDLGGVILDLSVKDTLVSFSGLSGLPLDQVKSLFVSSREFESYERGGMDDRQFRDLVRGLYKVSVSDVELDRSWNAMLLGIPKPKLDLLLELKKQYRTFLLSNTNGIHLDYINSIILPPLTGERTLDRFFHGSYYSHLMGMRKPDEEIFLRVLQDNELKASETLFLDDNADNIKGANNVGIQTVHVTHPDLVIEYFNR
jgi:putative hydrolase of the HAD superfamily